MFLKPGYSAFAGTTLAQTLRGRGASRVAIMGAVAEMCVLETAADALAEGFGVVVLAGATVPLESREAQAALGQLRREGARVLGW